MARPPRTPLVLVEATIKRSQKLAALPSDAARLGFFYVVLGEAKLQKPVPGQFASRQVFRECAGRFGRFLARYIEVGILEEAPALCQRCAKRWADMVPEPGVLVVHDWAEYQHDPWHAERQAAYEARKATRGSDGNGSVSDGKPDAVSDAYLARGRPGRRAEARTELGTLNSRSHRSNGFEKGYTEAWGVVGAHAAAVEPVKVGSN